MSKLKKILKDPLPYIIYGLGRILRGSLWADKLYLKILYKSRVGKSLDIKSPKTFNEKIQWLKLYDRRPQYASMVDKFEAKEYVKKKIGEQYIIPTYGVWNSFDEIEFEKLPKKFVLKCTHDSGGFVIVTDKNQFDKASAKKKISRGLKRNYYLNTREWPYKNIKPRIIAEKFIGDDNALDLNDYKFMCFNGKVKCTFVFSNRFDKNGLCLNVYDTEWKPLPFTRKYQRNPIEIVKPSCYEKMVELAEKLSEGIDFLRVDFYEYSGEILFGELTLYPGSGVGVFEPEEWDLILGSWIKLPMEKGEIDG